MKKKNTRLIRVRLEKAGDSWSIKVRYENGVERWVTREVRGGRVNTLIRSVFDSRDAARVYAQKVGLLAQRLTVGPGQEIPEGAIDVRDGTAWANPFKIGTVENWYGVWVRVTPDVAVQMFRADPRDPSDWALWSDRQDQIKRHLSGKDLVCDCPLDQPCHADVLLEVANGF